MARRLLYTFEPFTGGGWTIGAGYRSVLSRRTDLASSCDAARRREARRRRITDPHNNSRARAHLVRLKQPVGARRSPQLFAGLAPAAGHATRDGAMSDIALRYLYFTAAHGSMRAAGEQLNVAVSSISRQIAQLEQALGLRLLETGRRTIKLTLAGQLAFDFYQAQAAQRDAFAARLEGLRDAKTGSVCLALADSVPTLSLHGALDGFRTRHPGVELHLACGSSDEIRRMIAEDEADLGVSLATPADPKLRVRTSVRQPLMVIVHPDHPLAACDGITLSDLAHHDLCLPPPGSRLRQLLAPAELREQTWLRATITTNSVPTMRDLALSGRAATVLPRISVQAEIDSGLLSGIALIGYEAEDPCLELITRLGRQLPQAATLLMTALEQQLNVWSCPPAAPRNHRSSVGA
jgi:DNA-binding transcriptional LysR family regulator